VLILQYYWRFRLGRRVSAVITDMNQPLGQAVGNALEVREAVQLLSGQIAAGDPLYEVCMLLGVQLLLHSGLETDKATARNKLEDAIRSGAGLRKLQQMIACQGGDGSVLTVERIDELCAVQKILPLQAKATGYVADMNAAMIGSAAQMLGAGRAKKEDVIDPAVGLVMQVRRGDYVKAGAPLCVLYVNDETYLQQAEQLLYRAITVADAPPAEMPFVYGIVESSDR